MPHGTCFFCGRLLLLAYVRIVAVKSLRVLMYISTCLLYVVALAVCLGVKQML